MSSLLRIPLLFASFVLLVLLFGFLTFKVLSFSRTVEVPSLADMTLLEANDALSRTGLYLKIEGEEFDSRVESGRIIRQDVPAGNKVKEKRSIKVFVSKGPRISSVPSVVNMTVPDADAMLMQQGIKIGKTVYVHSDFVEKGKIVAQRPEPDEKLSGSLTVLVSLGPHEVSYTCPDFTNKSADEARETAGKMGLAVETNGAGDIVSAQKPKPGSAVRSGEKLYLELKEE